MIVKMMITFDYDPETNEYKPIKQEIVKDKAQSKATKEAKDVEESSEPQVTLDTTKYILNHAAAELLGVEWEDRIDIKYKPLSEKNSTLFPIIGKADAWGTKSGNKLTKSLTVSCRGNSNDLLAKYGDTFTLTPWKGHEGLFVLVGNADTNSVVDDNVEITEPTEEEEDLPLDTDLDVDVDTAEDTDIIEDDSFEL